MRIEIHAHTDESSSCGKIPAKELVRLNKEAGVDALTITDHYSTHAFNKITGSPREKAEYFLRGWRIAKEEGIGIDVVSAGELYTAVKAGFPMENAYFAQMRAKDRADLILHVQA